MKKIFALILAALLCAGVFAGCGTSEMKQGNMHTITDAAGRQVEVPEKVGSIVCVGVGALRYTCYVGAADLVVGVEDYETKAGMSRLYNYVNFHQFQNLPVIGTNGQPYTEEIINLAPDLVIIHPSTARDGFAQQIRDVGIPAININFSNYETMIKAYTMLGEILGGEYQEKLATWCDEVAAKQGRSQELTAGIADEDKPVVHYISGQGESLTTTMSKGSIIQSWVENSGGLYAPAVMELEGTEVTAEQIFELNPDIIIVGGTYQHVLLKQLQESDGWKDLDAVKNGRVYTNPYGCFNWDRFGLESNLQLDYALMCIQPEIAAENGIDRDYMVQEIVDFYGFYNGKEMTLEEAGFMLDGLMPTGEAEIPAA